MGKLIQMPALRQAENERKSNIKQLKALIDKYVTNKKFMINKIKKEQ
jgi:hypothetical protein